MTAASSPPPRDGEVCAALVAELDTFLGQWRTVGAIPFELAGIVDRYRPAAPSEPPAADSPTPGIEVAGERTIYPCRCWGDSYGIHLHKHDRHFIAPSPVGTTERPAEPSTCTHRISSYHEDEITYACGAPATVEALTTSGQWEPICDRHGAGRGLPSDRLRPLSEPPAETQQDDERVARRFLARHYWLMASAVNVGDWHAYIRTCARAQEDGSAWLDNAALVELRAALATRPSADTETLRRVRELADQWLRDGYAPRQAIDLRRILDGPR